MKMKIYMLITDEDNILVDNIMFVTKKYDAEKLVLCGKAKYYEIIDTLNSVEVENIYKLQVARG